MSSGKDREFRESQKCSKTVINLVLIVAGASPGETKMWAAVRENGDFWHLRFE